MNDIKNQAEDQEISPDEIKKKKPRLFRWALALIGIYLLILLIAGFAGNRLGIQDRVKHEAQLASTEIASQYQLALDDIEAQRYQQAIIRLDYILEYEPGNVMASDKLEQVQFIMNFTATPTIEPTPTMTPTPDLRGLVTLMESAEADFLAGEWDSLILTLDTLRGNFPDHNSVEIDGYYFAALRNRGVQRILYEGKLESGIYDLNMAEAFGPIDAQANSYREWANQYIAGASWWGINWYTSMQYFEELAINMPSLHDNSNLTSTDRFATAQAGFATQTITDIVFFWETQQYCALKEQAQYMIDNPGIFNYTPEEYEYLNKSINKCQLTQDAQATKDAQATQDASNN
jgi:hypothetical protein